MIQKLGTVDCDMVESAPVAFRGRLYRFDSVRENYRKRLPDSDLDGYSYFRLVDWETGEATAPFAKGYGFGCAFAEGDTLYVAGTQTHPGWSSSIVTIFASRDLERWESWNALDDPKYGICNTSICKAGSRYAMMFEIHQPEEETGVAFTARFAFSDDLRKWEVTPPECVYSRDRYTAPHCLRYLDGWFYDFYLESQEGWEQRVVRSRDLIRWEPSPPNPVLRASPEDKRIARETLSPDERLRIADALDINNSDIDFCEWQGRLYITYSWGNQQGNEFLAEAICEGTEAEFLRGLYPED